MSSNRLSGLNVALLVVTLAALMFGIYGFIRPMPGAEAAPRRANQCAAESTASADEDAQRERHKPLPREEKKSDSPKNASGTQATPRAETPKAPPAEAVNAAPSDKGDAAISGVVLSPDGKPLPNATVSARRSNLDLQPPVVDSKDPARSRDAVARYLSQVQSETRTSSSDSEGKFSFTGLDAKLAYDLSASIEGAGRAKADRVAAGDSVTLILQPSNWLVGRVVGPQSAPVTQFTVKIYRRNRQWEATQQSYLTQDGRFRMECAGGVMLVEIQSPGLTQGTPAEVNIDDSGNEQTFTLTQAAILTGTVRDKQGNTLPNVRVTTGAVDDRWDRRGYYDGYNLNPETRTDSQGRYRFDTLTPKEYTFTAVCGDGKDSRTLTLTLGENAQDFTVDAGVRVTLRLKDMRGKPVDAEQVWFLRKGNEWVQGERLPAKEAGVAEFTGLRPDEYTLSVTASGYPTLRRSLKLTGAQQIVDLELPDGAMLGGKITSSSGGAISGINIRLVKDGENENEAWGTGRWAQVQSDGTFRLGPVEPGLWSIDVMGQDWRKVGGDKRNLVVGENKFDLTLNTGGTLVVRVTDENGKAAGMAYVSLSSGNGKNYGGQCNQQGVATINFIEPGDYNMTVAAQAMAAPAMLINVRDGQNETTVTLKKPNCARITSVAPGSQGARIGLQVGDLIIEYNNEKILSWEDVGRIRRKYRDNEDVTMLIERGGQLQSFNLKGGQIGIDGESAVR